MAPRAARPPLRLGIFGGTFDPVHHGHLILARDALEQARLDAVLFVPCVQSPHKHAKPLTADTQRVAMLRRALKGEKRFWLSLCELDRGFPSYSIDTAEEIAAAFPHAELFWLIGADQLARLREWHHWEELRERVIFLLLERGTAALRKSAGRVLSLPHPRRVDISATEIRHRVKSRLPIDHLLPASVVAYIQRQGLYL
jgi:nicotinate-nucleotide adenylyltransferase